MKFLKTNKGQLTITKNNESIAITKIEINNETQWVMFYINKYNVLASCNVFNNLSDCFIKAKHVLTCQK